MACFRPAKWGTYAAMALFFAVGGAGVLGRQAAAEKRRAWLVFSAAG
jgi:hypothetical protein